MTRRTDKEWETLIQGSIDHISREGVGEMLQATSFAIAQDQTHVQLLIEDAIALLSLAAMTLERVSVEEIKFSLATNVNPTLN